MVYIIDGPNFSHKRHLNQLRKRWSDDINCNSPEQEEAMDVIFDIFDLPSPQPAPKDVRKKD